MYYALLTDSLGFQGVPQHLLDHTSGSGTKQQPGVRGSGTDAEPGVAVYWGGVRHKRFRALSREPSP